LLRDVVAVSPDPTELVKRVLARARERAVDWDRDDVTLVAVKLDRDGGALRSDTTRR